MFFSWKHLCVANVYGLQKCTSYSVITFLMVFLAYSLVFKQLWNNLRQFSKNHSSMFTGVFRFYGGLVLKAMGLRGFLYLKTFFWLRDTPVFCRTM
jgi:hypothetical protein